ncbi:MAG: succinate dehydrogenase cytochrome b subunit [Actinomycetes bacterium]
MTDTLDRPGAQAPIVHPPKRRSAAWPVQFWSTAVGKKWVMAVTGIGLMGFVFAHMVGNAKMFLGAAEYNRYAEALRQLLVPIMPPTVVLWGMRLGLATFLVLHVVSAAQLTAMNRRARPTRYQSSRDYIAANFASRSMRWTGIIVFLFVVFHLANLTWGVWVPGYVKPDAYGNVVANFKQWPISAIYIVANIAVGIHLFHGAWSMFQSLGLNNPRYNGARRGFAAGFAVLVAGVNCLFPIMVLAGVVH